MHRNKEIGRKGEEIALNYLKKNHYEIIELNWCIGHKEIDIIARDGAVTFRFDQNGVQAEAYRQAQPRYWYGR